MSGAFVQGDDRILLDGTTFLSGAFEIKPLPLGQKMLDLRAGAGSGGGPLNVDLIPAPGGFNAAKLYGDATLGSLTADGLSTTTSIDVIGIGAGDPIFTGVSALSTLNTNFIADKLDGYHASGLGRLDSSATWDLAQIFSATASFQAPDVPFVVVGTDQVDNLNANYLQGFDAAHFADADNLSAGTVSLAQGGTDVDNSAQAINLVFATPASGGAGAMSIRALVAADVPSLDAAKITTGNLARARHDAQTMFLDAASQTLVNGLTVGGALAASTTLAVTSRAGIGGASATDSALKVAGTSMTGASQYGVFNNPTFSAAASNFAVANYLKIATAASLTMPSLRGIYLDAPSIGASNTIGQVIGIHIVTFSTSTSGTNTGLLIGSVSGGATGNFAISTGTGICKFGDEVNIIGALNHDGALCGFRGLAPVALPAAVTQTYATADRTHAARTAAALTDSVAGTVGTTLAAIPNPADTPATADALRDDIVANVLPKIRDAISSLADQVNKGRADALDTSQLVNVLVDDLQLQGLEG